MSILTVLIILIAVGVGLYLVNNKLPIDPKIKSIINWATIGIVIIWLLRISGVLGWLSGAKI